MYVCVYPCSKYYIVWPLKSCVCVFGSDPRIVSVSTTGHPYEKFLEAPLSRSATSTGRRPMRATSWSAVPQPFNSPAAGAATQQLHSAEERGVVQSDKEQAGNLVKACVELDWLRVLPCSVTKVAFLLFSFTL